MNLRVIALFAFMGIAIIAHAFADEVPGYEKLLEDLATACTGLAALVMRPPWTPMEK